MLNEWTDTRDNRVMLDDMAAAVYRRAVR